MIRYVHCVKRRADVSPEDFRHYWNGGEFIQLLDQQVALTGVVRQELSLTLIIPENVRLTEERGSGEPFDAMLDVRWQRGVGLTGAFSIPAAARLMIELTACQACFIGLSASPRFFTES